MANAGVSFEVKNYPYLAEYDTVDVRGQARKHGDGKITQADVSAWFKKEYPTFVDEASDAQKLKLFQARNAQREFHFKLIMAGFHGFPRNIQSLEQTGEALYKTYQARLESELRACNGRGNTTERLTCMALHEANNRIFGIHQQFTAAAPAYPVFGGGIGMAFHLEDSSAVVDGVIKDSPAHKAGLKKGDHIIAIGGEHPAVGTNVVENLAAIPLEKPVEDVRYDPETHAPWQYDEQWNGGQLMPVTAYIGTSSTGHVQEDLQYRTQKVRGAILGTPGSIVRFDVLRKGKQLPTIELHRDYNTFVGFFSPAHANVSAHNDAGKQGEAIRSASLFAGLPLEQIYADEITLGTATPPIYPDDVGD